jgi:hypothetical protein
MPQWEVSTGKNPEFQKYMPDASLKLDKTHLHEFFRTMYERQNIWWRREVLKQSFPWTEDKYLRDYKFCNVYRVLDRNSQYEFEHVVKPYQSKFQFIWRVCFFRLFNQPDFFRFLEKKKGWKGGIPTWEEYKEGGFDLELMMREYRKQGGNPFTNAYLTNSLACPGMTRDWCFANKVIPTLHEKVQELWDLSIARRVSPAEWCKKANELPSVSGFVSHEFFLSLCYREEFGFGKFNGWNRNMFTNVGPGASLGLSLILPSRRTNKEQLEGLHWINKRAKSYLKKHFPDFKYLKWDGKEFSVGSKYNIMLTDIEFWLCEYQKYWKMTIGVGKQRSKYMSKQV